jgi:transcriptional regulator with XRE-family HTH domain
MPLVYSDRKRCQRKSIQIRNREKISSSVKRLHYSARVSAATPTFGDLLARRLKAARLSQTAFAKKCGLSPGSINNLIAGRRTPPPEKVPAMAEALGLNADDAKAFTQAASTAHVPEDMRANLAALWKENAQRGREIDKLKREIAELQRITEGPPTASDEEYREMLGTLPTMEVLKIAVAQRKALVNLRADLLQRGRRNTV